MRIYLFLMTMFVFGCNAQNSVTTNEIIRTKDNLFGVKSKEGKLLIDSIYKNIRIVSDRDKLTLPPKEGRLNVKQSEYYLVSNSDNQKALFNKNGKLIFGFINCLSIIVDPHTQTIVTTKKIQANTRARSYLYNLKGDLLFDTSYENIGFIDNSDLIALVAEDGQNEEFYLYNPFTKKKIGAIDHFNIYTGGISPRGLRESDFEKYKKLKVITIRREVDNDYVWGMVDPKGNEILPLEYRKLTILLESHKNHPMFKAAIKSEGVEFCFKGAHISKPSTVIYFDSNFEKYELKTISAEKREYRMEKM